LVSLRKLRKSTGESCTNTNEGIRIQLDATMNRVHYRVPCRRQGRDQSFLDRADTVPAFAVFICCGRLFKNGSIRDHPETTLLWLYAVFSFHLPRYTLSALSWSVR